MAKTCFDIFDVDRVGLISLDECDALVRMLYGVADADPTVLAYIDGDGDGNVSALAWTELVAKRPVVIQPAFDLQRALRKRCLGVRAWEAKTRWRRTALAGYDGGEDSWSAMKEIVAIKSKAREAAAASAEAEAARDAAKQAELAEARRAAAAEDLVRRQARRRAAKRRAVSDEDRAAEAAFKTLDAAEAALAADATLDGLPARAIARAVFWAAVETAFTKGTLATRVGCERKLVQCLEGDALAKASHFLETHDDGRAKLWFETQKAHGRAIHDALAASRFAWRRKWAWLYVSASPSQVPFLAAQSAKWTSKAGLAAAREAAFQAVVAEFRAEERAQMGPRVAKAVADYGNGLRRRREAFVFTYGLPTTLWERLFDPDRREHYYLQWTARGDVPDDARKAPTGFFWESNRLAVCHVCDASLDGLDVKCFGCLTGRSEHNKALYTGATIL